MICPVISGNGYPTGMIITITATVLRIILKVHQAALIGWDGVAPGTTNHGTFGRLIAGGTIRRAGSSTWVSALPWGFRAGPPEIISNSGGLIFS